MSETYRCTICGFPHKSISPLRDHILDVHGKEFGNVEYIERIDG